MLVRVRRLISRLLLCTLAGALVSVAFGPVVRAEAASLGAMIDAGQRPNATRLGFNVSDRIRAQVDVGSGNLLVTVKGMTLQAWGGRVEVGASYNSAARDLTPAARLGKGWSLDYTPDVRLVANSDGSVSYYGPGGLSGLFPLVSGSTTSYTSAKGFKADLVKTSSGWDLTERTTKVKRTFNTSGDLTAVTDRNANKTTVVTSTGSTSVKDVTVTSTAGPTTGRIAMVKTDAAGVTRITQPQLSPSRTMSFQTSAGTLASTTDFIGKTSIFSYDGSGLVTKIEAPGAAVVQFGYDASKRVTSITQTVEGTALTTRLAYSSGQTLLAAPTTDQAVTDLAQIPHTTYTINADKRVSKAVDAEGRTRSTTYTANFDTATASTGATNTSTVTNTYGANGGESLTKSQSPTGASQTLSYANASPNQYLPSSGADDAGNNSTYTYNGTGNALTSTDANTNQAKLTYNADGTVATATSPGNGTNNTRYSYTNKQLVTMNPVTGTSLATRTYSYDRFGRLRTASNGRGITATYNYDDNDRVTSIGYTGGDLISFGYNDRGDLTSRTDPNSTTSWTYDSLGRLTSRSNSLFGGTISYTYNKDSQLASVIKPVAAGGSVSYGYDKAGKLVTLDYQYNGQTKTLRFANDDHGRRTDAWLGANADHTTWAVHHKVSYDKSDRPSRVLVDQGTGDASHTTIVDLSYCYAAGTTASTGCTQTAGTDRTKLVWRKDNLTGEAVHYSYDKSGRLTKAAVSGGSATPVDYTYTYDKNGNRLTKAGTAQIDRTYTYNAANQVTSTGWVYDGAGNLTHHPDEGDLTYTAADQMASATPAGGPTYTYTYAGASNDELIRQTTPLGTYEYAYGRTSPHGVPIIEELGHDGNIASITSDPTTGQPLMLRTSSGMQSLYIYDGTPGSPIALVTSEAYVGVAIDYDPFGTQTLAETSGGDELNQNPYYFAAGVRDRTTGWQHYGARYFDNYAAVFTQQDTLDAPLDPTNANRYTYANNDPINQSDPAGKSCVLAWVFLFGDAAAFGYGVVTAETGIGLVFLAWGGVGVFRDAPAVWRCIWR